MASQVYGQASDTLRYDSESAVEPSRRIMMDVPVPPFLLSVISLFCESAIARRVA